jgi:hypothetical protein
MEREMGVADIKARVERLDRLARGLAKEVGLWRGCKDPLLYRERKAYLGAVQEALAGVEAAEAESQLSPPGGQRGSDFQPPFRKFCVAIRA